MVSDGCGTFCPFFFRLGRGEGEITVEILELAKAFVVGEFSFRQGPGGCIEGRGEEGEEGEEEGECFHAESAIRLSMGWRRNGQI